jgi:hypothetical protein
MVEDSNISAVSKQAIAGACAGFVFANIAFPFDLLKVRKQASVQLQGISYGEELKMIYKAEGLRGFTRGYSGLLIRDVPGFAIYFGAFEGFKTLFGVANRKQDTGLSKGQTALRKFLAGGLAGVVTWTIAFPADTIKTKMQTAKQGDNASTMQVFAKVVRQEGFFSLYRGIHV